MADRAVGGLASLLQMPVIWLFHCISAVTDGCCLPVDVDTDGENCPLCSPDTGWAQKDNFMDSGLLHHSEHMTI